MYTVQVSHEISYGHRLLHTQGKCQRLHGHNASITVTLSTRVMHPPHNMVVDFSEVKRRLRACLDRLDHNTVLNAQDPFLQFDAQFIAIEDGDPTAERMAKWVFDNIGLNYVQSVKWQETRDCSATYIDYIPRTL